MLWYLLGYETEGTEEETEEVQVDEQTKRLRHNMLKEIRRMRVIDTLCEMAYPEPPSVITVPVSKPIDIPRLSPNVASDNHKLSPCERKYGNKSRTRHNRIRKKKRKKWG